MFKSRLEELIGQSSLRSFGTKCGISESVLRKYLKETSEPGLGNLVKIALASNVTVGWLVGEGEEEQKKSTVIHTCLPDKSMQEMSQWINEQNDGINYWEVAKAKLAQDFPDFKEWLKKHSNISIKSNV